MTDQPMDREQLQREEVAGAAGGWLGPRSARSLPWAFDDLTRELGDDIYERMLLDPQVIASVNVLRASILAEGLEITPAITDPDADGYELAQEICGFVCSAIADMDTAIDDVLWDMLKAIALGARVAEQVYRLEAGRLTLHALKVKQRRSTAFVADAYQNVLGLVAQRPGQGGVLGLGSLILADGAAAVPGLLPRQKFAVLSFRPQDSDPRGTTVLRPAYQPWWAKQQTWQELLKYLAQFASPSIWGATAEKAGEVVTKDAAGNVTERKSAVQALLDTLLSFKNGTALAVPYGTMLNTLQVSGEGAAFFGTFDFCDRQIVTAVLHQTLSTLEGQHQSRAASETHADILSTIIRQARRAVALMVRRDVLWPLVQYNWGDAARPLVPAATLGIVEQIDVAALANAMAALARAQYLHPSQLAGIDQLLGLPPRVVAPGEAPAGLGTTPAPDPAVAGTGGPV